MSSTAFVSLNSTPVAAGKGFEPPGIGEFNFDQGRREGSGRGRHSRAEIPDPIYGQFVYSTV